MKKAKSKVGSRLIAIGMLITIIFLILKFTHVVAWQWVWIFSPLWISFGLNVVINLIGETVRDIIVWYKNKKIKN